MRLAPPLVGSPDGGPVIYRIVEKNAFKMSHRNLYESMSHLNGISDILRQQPLQESFQII